MTQTPLSRGATTLRKLRASLQRVGSAPLRSPSTLSGPEQDSKSKVNHRLRRFKNPFRLPRLAEDIYPPRVFNSDPNRTRPPPPSRYPFVVNLLSLANKPTLRHAPSDPRNMLAYIDVLSTPSVDTPGACLRLCFDNRHYIFGNVSEGTQRIMASKRMSMAKVEDVFLTGPVDWHANGGMLGFLLTIADVHETVANALGEAGATAKKNKPTLDHVNVHGARNLAHMLATGRRFVYRKSFPLVPLEVWRDPRGTGSAPSADSPDWADDNIRVWYVPVESSAAAVAVAAQPGKSKKRKAEHMSGSDGESTAAATGPQPPNDTSKADGPRNTGANSLLSQDDIDQQLRLAVVARMFNSKAARAVERREQPVLALREPEPGRYKYEESFGVYTVDVNGNIQQYDRSGDSNAKPLVPKRDWKAADVKHLPPVERSSMSMCYVVKLFPGKGKFNAAKAAELGVKKPDYKLLVDGQTVLGKDGIEVTPGMVVGPAGEATGFALVEVPDATYIDGLLARAEWKDKNLMNGLAAMYWIVRAPEVLSDDRILAFMREKSGMTHTVLSRTEQGTPCLIGKSAIEVRRLKMVAGDLFHAVAHIDGDSSSPTNPQDPMLPFEVGSAGAQLKLKPKVLAVKDNVVKPATDDEVMEELVADPEIMRLAGEAMAKVTDPSFLEAMAEATADLPNPDAEVIPLGTGSALPSRSRNVSCTLVRVPGVGTYMLDCGENSLGQLRRMYGYEGADEVLRDLKAIWISHSHADHHLGTISVLKRFSEVVPLSTTPDAPQQKVALIAHPLYHHFLAEYAQAEPLGLDTHVELISNEKSAEPASAANGFARDLLRPIDDASLLAPFGLSRVAVCRVDHCDDARAVALTLASSGLKIAYSGDCRPSRAFATDCVGGGAHLLVHEATLDDELHADAVAKKHCTTGEALRVARQMRARNVLLTHFSQRYPKLPEVGNAEQQQQGEGAAPVVFAFDFMRVRLGEFRAAREFIPALQRLYADEGVKAGIEKPAEKVLPGNDADGRLEQVVTEVVEEVIQEVEDKVVQEKTADV